MEKQLLKILIGFVAIWDTVTTVYGTWTIVGAGTVQIVMSVLFSFVITGFLLRTIPIIKNPSEELIPTGAKVLWFLAVGYDLYTAYLGNFDLILNRTSSGPEKVIIAVGITIFICSSPIGLSSLFYEGRTHAHTGVR